MIEAIWYQLQKRKRQKSFTILIEQQTITFRFVADDSDDEIGGNKTEILRETASVALHCQNDSVRVDNRKRENNLKFFYSIEDRTWKSYDFSDDWYQQKMRFEFEIKVMKRNSDGNAIVKQECNK